VVKKGRLKLIGISEENYWHLKNLGLAGDSFNDVITKLLLEKRKK
jgi:predicted CopG family antitoxin